MTFDLVTSRQRQWSHQLFDCIREMAMLQSNAVLQVLAGVDMVEAGRHYPDGGLSFAGNRWRAYYHCHEAAENDDREHGHFHVFTATGMGEWAHVAGLAMDVYGQPVSWFAVNRWVTDGPWLERAQLEHRLQSLKPDRQESLVGRWLCAMLQAQQTELAELFVARDQRLRCYQQQSDDTGLLDDRDLYLLATKPVALQAMLEKNLLH